MHYGPIITVVSVLTLLQAVLGGKTCYEDEKLTAGGKCEPCEFCPSGQGIDLEVKILTNEDGDALECRPCKPCPAGYWNDNIYGQMTCMMCRLNCSLLFRKEYRACGGSSQGQCDACINSQYEDRDNNIESACIEKKTDIKLLPEEEPDHTAKPIVSSVEKNGARGGSPVIQGIIIFAAICGVVSIASGAVFIACYLTRRKSPRGNANPELGSSDDTILSNGSSEMGEMNYSTKHSNKDDDLEVDGPMLDEDHVKKKHRASGPHPELVSLLSSGPAALRMTVEKETKKTRRDYPKFLLKADDAFIDLTRKEVYDEGKYKPMFRDLGLSDQDLHAEYLHFYHEKHNYDYMIRRYLEKWLSLAGKGATFDVLCKALDDHEFHTVSLKLLALNEKLV